MTRRNEHRGARVAGRAMAAAEYRVRSLLLQVKWTDVVDAAAIYTERQVFALWVRAVTDAAGKLPNIGECEFVETAPVLRPVLLPAYENRPSGRRLTGYEVWEHIMSAVDDQELIAANHGGWLDAVHYFSALSLRSIKGWAHWDKVNRQWGAEQPRSLPSFGQWTRDVEAIVYLGNRSSSAQHLLDMVRSLPAVDWSRLVSELHTFVAFCIWATVIRKREGCDSERIKDQTQRRYPGLLTPAAGTPADIASAFVQWFTPDLTLQTPNCISALGFYIRSLPAYHAWQAYVDHCLRSARTNASDFESWLSAANYPVGCLINDGS